MFSIDFAGRKIVEGDIQHEAMDADVTSGPARIDSESQGVQAASTPLASLSHAGAAPKGPKIDLMGPTLQQDMYLGAQYSRPQGPVSLKNDNLYGRSREIYELLTEIFKPSSKDKMKVEESSSRSGNILQHERDDPAALMSMDVPESIREMENYCDDPNQSDDTRSEYEEASNYTGLGDIVTDHSDDQGVCLSMHQPWASLVVHGIKKVEGRGWSTSHRGRLWIAATKRRPLQSEVDAVLQQYEELRQLQGFREPEMLLPEHYPTSVLLGCVDVVDCVSRESFPPDADEEKTECAYGFILDKPCRLSITPKILGQPKIWPLETQVLARAQKQLRYVVPVR
uniref:ASCH domain-containing protein n=1 Tax=Guillardia theta TaxID=55529 RepID=A0A7S4NV91_GUITH